MDIRNKNYSYRERQDGKIISTSWPMSSTAAIKATSSSGAHSRRIKSTIMKDHSSIIRKINHFATIHH